MVNIAVLVSGGGTNLQALIDRQGENPYGKLALVVSSKADVFALKRAENSGIPTAVVARKAYATPQEFDAALLAVLRRHNISVVVLAGFLCILGNEIIDCYRDRILNVHPSLIPAFCGDGFYGLRVHKAVLDCGVKVTGATVHLVSEITDGGRILLQKAVAVLESDTPETLQKRVMEQAEWDLLPKAVTMLCRQVHGQAGQRGLTAQPDDTLRFAGREDATMLTDLRMAYLREDFGGLTPERETVLAGQLQEYFAAHLGNDCLAVLLELDGQAVSTAVLLLCEKPASPSFPTGKTAQLLNVYTLPNYRRRGYSTRVLKLLLETARQKGASYIEVSATQDGKPLYETLGFTEYRSRYTGMRLDLINGVQP